MDFLKPMVAQDARNKELMRAQPQTRDLHHPFKAQGTLWRTERDAAKAGH